MQIDRKRLTKLINKAYDTSLFLFNIAKKSLEFLFELTSDTSSGEEGGKV